MSKALIEAAASYFGMDPARLNMDTSTMTVGAKMALRFTLSFDATDDDYIGICKRMAERRKFSVEENLGKFLGVPRKEGSAAPSNWSKQPEPTIGMVYSAVTRIEKSIQDAIDAAQPVAGEDQPAPEQELDQFEFAPMPSLEHVMADPVAYIDQPRCSDLLRRAMQLSKEVERKVCEAREKQVGMPVYFNNNTPMPTPTVRVDKAPAEPAPNYVEVPNEKLEESFDKLFGNRPTPDGDGFLHGTGVHDEPANRLQAKMEEGVWMFVGDITKEQMEMAIDSNLPEGTYKVPLSALSHEQRIKLVGYRPAGTRRHP